jgi:hypothetical protein
MRRREASPSSDERAAAPKGDQQGIIGSALCEGSGANRDGVALFIAAAITGEE